MSGIVGGNLALDDQEIKPIIDDSELIGGVYDMNYDTCTIVSHDYWKNNAGGVSRHCFLLATAADWEDPDEFSEEDAYALLLRAKGPASLPAEDDLMKVREEAMRKKITEDTDEDDATVPGTSDDVMDVLTRNEIQFSGIEADILGTVYQEENEIKFGSDAETFYSSARYKVYKPGAEALKQIFSHLHESDDSDNDEEQSEDQASMLPIGRVRYSSTERRTNLDDATVPIDIDDIIGNKTALFGMTRTGKSNTMKILATAVFRQTIGAELEVGQLLFDPAGEYANVNTQDEGTALADLPDDVVTVYSWSPDEEDVESLRMNFLDYEQIEAVWNMIKLNLTRTADYVESFKAANVVGPDEREGNRGEYNRALRRRAALYACLIRAGFAPDDGWDAPVPTNSDLRDEVNAITTEHEFEPADYGGNGWVFMDSNELTDFFEIIRNNQEDVDEFDNFVDNELDSILTLFNMERGNGYEILEPLNRYHEPGREGYYPEQIYQNLAEGDTVIVDLTTGTDEINQRISKTIVEHIVEEQVDMFTDNEEPHNIQVYIEEAHRLFGSDYLDDADDTDPYVRLAKEAAKFNIGLIYATQEVSSVDGSVLANTANWIVTHLNNTNETNELSSYYDFGEFENHILNSEDKGFARVKTLSGEFIIPTQIHLFDTDTIETAADEYREDRDDQEGIDAFSD